jgi:hypothetical protein
MASTGYIKYASRKYGEGGKKTIKQKVRKGHLRDSDKDEVERDDLMHEEVLELIELLDSKGKPTGEFCWSGMTKGKLYAYRKGMDVPVPKLIKSQKERDVYKAVEIGKRKKEPLKPGDVDTRVLEGWNGYQFGWPRHIRT